MAGINRAIQVLKSESRLVASAAQQKPCIFLSHVSIDKGQAQEIGNYIMQKGDLDIYLDVNDDRLQAAVRANDAEAITTFIEKGLAESSHVMCLVSEDTVKSWWVPYELGFAKNAKKHLSTLFIKGTVTIPAYLKVSQLLKGTASLNKYLKEVADNNARIVTESKLVQASTMQHPLDTILNWRE